MQIDNGNPRGWLNSEAHMHFIQYIGPFVVRGDQTKLDSNA
jgi:hypothetical protein